MILMSVVLPPPDGPMMVTNSPGEIVHVLEHEWLGLGAAERDVSQLEAAANLPGIDERPIVPAFNRRERNVRKALQVQAKKSKVERLFDQLNRLLGEMLFVGASSLAPLRGRP